MNTFCCLCCQEKIRGTDNRVGTLENCAGLEGGDGEEADR
jgi:hypothetical protein